MQLPDALIEPRFRDHFAEHLPVQPRGTRLLRGDRLPDLAAELLQALVIDAAELFDRNLGAADLGDRRTAETTENVVDAPNRKAQRQKMSRNSLPQSGFILFSRETSSS